MTAVLDIPEKVAPETVAPALPIVVRAAAALAVSTGIGRFVYTPILPLMRAQTGLSAHHGSTLATANYVGYLVGALVAIFAPASIRFRATLRVGLLALVATLGMMAVSSDYDMWLALRLVAGIASALVFVGAISGLLAHFRHGSRYLVGWGFGGLGAGIALSGLIVLIVRSYGTWRTAWIAAAVSALVLSAVAWSLEVGAAAPNAAAPNAAAPTAARRPSVEGPGSHRWFVALVTSYSLEAVGYIIAGTFLVAAINQSAPGWVGSGAWIVVGLAALPSSVLWAALNRRWSRPSLLCGALTLQAVGIALPALAGGLGPALISAVLFGATFVGVVSIALPVGDHLRLPRAVAILTTGYGIGQILGPLVTTPLVNNGYRLALLVGAAIVMTAAVAAAALRAQFPLRVGDSIDPSRTTGRKDLRCHPRSHR